MDCARKRDAKWQITRESMLCQARSSSITEFLGLVRRPTNQRPDDYSRIKTSLITHKSFIATINQVTSQAPALNLANIFHLPRSYQSLSLYGQVFPIRTCSCYDKSILLVVQRAGAFSSRYCTLLNDQDRFYGDSGPSDIISKST